MSTENTLPQAMGLKPLCQHYLNALRDTVSDLRLAVVATADGFPIAMLDTSVQNGRRATAMAAALNGLSRSITQELATGQLEGTVLECQEGLILCRHVATPKRALVLLMVVGEQSTYGHALWAIKTAAKDLSAALQTLAEANQSLKESEHNG